MMLKLRHSHFAPVMLFVSVIVVIWYAGAVAMNAPFQRGLDARAGEAPGLIEFIGKTLSQPKPTLPAPHQVASTVAENVFARKITSNRSLVWHGWVTLSTTLLGFVLGAALGVALAIGVIHVRSLEISLIPWLIISQTVPIIALAPMVILLLGPLNTPPLVTKALIATYLSFFPVAVGMVTGLRSPELTHLDLMRSYDASRWAVFWKLRLPASLPFLFASLKIAVAASLIGAIVAELPTGAVAGIGAKLLIGAYHSQSIDIWAALFVGAVLAASLVALVGLAERMTMAAFGGRLA